MHCSVETVRGVKAHSLRVISVNADSNRHINSRQGKATTNHLSFARVPTALPGPTHHQPLLASPAVSNSSARSCDNTMEPFVSRPFMVTAPAATFLGHVHSTGWSAQRKLNSSRPALIGLLGQDGLATIRCLCSCTDHTRKKHSQCFAHLQSGPVAIRTFTSAVQRLTTAAMLKRDGTTASASYLREHTLCMENL